MSFWGGSSSSSSSSSSGDDAFAPSPSASGSQTKDDVMRAIQQQMAQQKIAALVQEMQRTCFQRCIAQPSSSISSSENACITSCVQKYMGVLDAVSKQWNKSVSEMGGGAGSLSR